MTGSIAEILTQLHTLPWQFNPPATESELVHLAAELDCPLDESLLAIYRDHNGVQEHLQLRFLMRLMSIEEVIQTHRMMEDFRAYHPNDMRTDVRLFWSDDNSNFGGIYVTGRLAGKICFYDHEVPGFEPRFRSVESYYTHLIPAVRTLDLEDLDNIIGWSEMPSDYPLLADAPATDAADLALALEYLATYQSISARAYANRQQRHFLAFTAMNLLPMSQSSYLLALTETVDDEEDMWVQGYACELLGKRRYLPAIPRLKEVALHGTHNGKLDVIRALGRMRTSEAKAALLEIQPYFGEGWQPHFKRLLEEVDP